MEMSSQSHMTNKLGQFEKIEIRKFQSWVSQAEKFNGVVTDAPTFERQIVERETSASDENRKRREKLVYSSIQNHISKCGDNLDACIYLG